MTRGADCWKGFGGSRRVDFLVELLLSDSLPASKVDPKQNLTLSAHAGRLWFESLQVRHELPA